MEHDSIGPQTIGKARPRKQPIALPPALVEVQLIDASTCAAVGDASESYWHEEVASGRAPRPKISRPRFARWSLLEVAAYWRKVAEEAAEDVATAEAVAAKAREASERARRKRGRPRNTQPEAASA